MTEFANGVTGLAVAFGPSIVMKATVTLVLTQRIAGFITARLPAKR